MPWVQSLNLPEETGAALKSLATELAAAAGDNLRSIVLYAGVVHGRFDPSRSNINIAIILGSTAPDALAALSPVLLQALREWRVDPLLISEAELPQVASAFATRFADIRRRRVVLHGADVFAKLEIDPADLRNRIEQELRNHVLRLRRWLVLSETPSDLLPRLAQTMGSVATIAAGLLELMDEPNVHDHLADLFDHLATKMKLNREVLAALLDVRDRPREIANPRALYESVLVLLDDLTRKTAQLEVGDP